MRKSPHQTVDHVIRFINQILFLKRKSVFKFRGVSFYPSEVHLMLAIMKGSVTNATKIAEQLGVTKGAISQTLSRLEKKGVLTKTKDTQNNNELILEFTPLGVAAHDYYQSLSADVRAGFARRLQAFSEPERAVIERFLVSLEDALEEIQ